jgi:hypothetical protein
MTVSVMKTNVTDFLYKDSYWTELTRYGRLKNGFLKDGHLYAAFREFESQNIVIYRVEETDRLVSTTTILGQLVERSPPGCIENAMAVYGDSNDIWLLAARWVSPVHPVEFLKNVVSGGHGIYYVKPILVEIYNGAVGEVEKLRYGGKRDESFYVKKVIQDENLVHFLGFRHPEVHDLTKENQPEMLHHVVFDLKKRKVVQTNEIYANIPMSQENASMSVSGENVYVVFLLTEVEISKNLEVKYVEANIFYWDYIDGKTSKVRKVAEGFHPIVKADSRGNAHLIWVNRQNNLMHKVKKEGMWQKENLLINKVDSEPYADNIAAAFDRDDHLHVVYPSGGNLIHAVIKVD